MKARWFAAAVAGLALLMLMSACGKQPKGTEGAAASTTTTEREQPAATAEHEDITAQNETDAALEYGEFDMGE